MCLPTNKSKNDIFIPLRTNIYLFSLDTFLILYFIPDVKVIWKKKPHINKAKCDNLIANWLVKTLCIKTNSCVCSNIIFRRWILFFFFFQKHFNTTEEIRIKKLQGTKKVKTNSVTGKKNQSVITPLIKTLN